VKERPILFSSAMVRALLAGTKTQTRRALKVQPADTPHAGQASRNRAGTRPVFYAAWEKRAADGSTICICPYGVPGDRLWVRESFAPLTKGYAYRADQIWNAPPADRWRPSIHMTRAASRITLEITDVRVERLQDISNADAIAEGIARGGPENPDDIERNEYRALWESINGPGSWDANPWVWCLSFRRVDAELAQSSTAAEEIAA
jgi:hypothetical protein